MNMDNIDDVIQEFVCCTKIPPDCKNCPQGGPGDDHGHTCKAFVKVDVYHALKTFRSISIKAREIL